MAEIKTTTTVEYSAEEMKQLIASNFFPGKQVDIKFVIQDVGGDRGDPLDRFPGHNEVTSVRISFDGVIDAKKNIAKAKKTTTVERTEPDCDDVKSVEYAPDYDDVKSDIDDAWEKIRRKFQ